MTPQALQKKQTPVYTQLSEMPAESLSFAQTPVGFSLVQPFWCGCPFKINEHRKSTAVRVASSRCWGLYQQSWAEVIRKIHTYGYKRVQKGYKRLQSLQKLSIPLFKGYKRALRCSGFAIRMMEHRIGQPSVLNRPEEGERFLPKVPWWTENREPWRSRKNLFAA